MYCRLSEWCQVSYPSFESSKIERLHEDKVMITHSFKTHSCSGNSNNNFRYKDQPPCVISDYYGRNLYVDFKRYGLFRLEAIKTVLRTLETKNRDMRTHGVVSPTHLNSFISSDGKKERMWTIVGHVNNTPNRMSVCFSAPKKCKDQFTNGVSHSDLFSFGSFLYFVFLGIVPFTLHPHQSLKSKGNSIGFIVI